jgi:hypothetical protein
MKHMEKKYRIEGFDEIEARLTELGAPIVGQSSSTHYYAPLTSNDVVKLVEHDGSCELHRLKEDGGKFTMTERRTFGSRHEGLLWLQSQGYEQVAIISMQHTDYGYGDGVIGLYIINDVLKSVILDLPPGAHEEASQTLGLDEAEVIAVPYNRYLEQAGQLKLTHIKTLEGTHGSDASRAA